MSKVATLMSSKLKVRKEIDCYGEEKKITLNKTAPYFSFETVKETFPGLRWWSKPPTIGKKIQIFEYFSFFCSVCYLGARSIQQKFQPVRPGKEDHLKRWTRFLETFPVGPNRSIEFWTEIS